MTNHLPIKALFVDIGGVLLTDGWGHESRQWAADVFNLDLTEMSDRHQWVSETFELGKITLGEYLDLVVFYQERTFIESTRKQLAEFGLEITEKGRAV